MAININISGAHGNLSNAAPLDDLGKQLEELDCFIHSTLYHFYYMMFFYLTELISRTLKRFQFWFWMLMKILRMTRLNRST